MRSRTEINQETYEQAVKFSQHFTKEVQAEFVAEAKARWDFEREHALSLQNKAENRPLVKTAIGFLTLALAVSVAIYWQSGRYDIVGQGQQLHQAFQVQTALEDKEQKNHRYISNLQDRLRENPNNGDLWYELGQAYALNNDFQAALICYQNAQKVLGEKAAILGAMATADYLEHQNQLTEQAQGWLNKALQLDPKETTSLLLFANHAYAQKNYTEALGYWRKALDSENDNVDRRAIIQSIGLAQSKLAEEQK